MIFVCVWTLYHIPKLFFFQRGHQKIKPTCFLPLAHMNFIYIMLWFQNYSDALLAVRQSRISEVGFL